MQNSLIHRFINVRSATYYWWLGGFVSLTGLLDYLTFFKDGNPGHLFSGTTATLMAAYVFYCGVLCKRDEFARIGNPAVKYSGYLAVALFAAGFITEVSISLSRVLA